MADEKPKPHPLPDRIAALVGLATALIAVLVGFGVLPGHSALAQLEPDELTDIVERAVAVVGLLVVAAARWRGKFEAAKG